ncbi:MAG: lysine--tRNA ligase [Spirochaetia bacterium]|nr:lysine--tRNA ligase [Spirochaetia bacterium]
MENHWADQVAANIIRQKPDREIYTVASGITPSGTVHIGNFRELITVDLVKRALEHKGKKVRFIFSWDDYDVFRKVPANMPNQELLKKYLGKPIVKTPDPYGVLPSYAKHHEKQMEDSIAKVGVHPAFIYQEERYRSSAYAEGMRQAMRGRRKIASILNEFRKEPLEENWVPVSIFCASCDSNETVISKYDEEYGLSYECKSCSHKESIDLRKTSVAKLLWRVDWPMRWSVEKVDFEPGGKDHSTDGGSFDTGERIVKEIYHCDPPVYLKYDFIRIKGKGGKISSSSGDVITLDELLRIYEPEMARWIFASYQPKVEFAISFDLDVLKNYEDYDRLERRYYGAEEVPEKQKDSVKRLYELSQIGQVPAQMPFQPSFRHLCNVLQIFGFDTERALQFYGSEIKNENDRKRFQVRSSCAVNWLREDAPEDFKFQLLTKTSVPTLEDPYRKAFQHLTAYLGSQEVIEETALSEKIYSIINELAIDNQIFFKNLYLALIGKEKGPKLASFMAIIGREKLLDLLSF